MSIFSRRRKSSKVVTPEGVVPKHVVLTAVAQCRDVQGNLVGRRRSGLLLQRTKHETPVVACITTAAGDLNLRWYKNHFYVRDGEERMQPGDEYVIRRFRDFTSEKEADLAMDAALDEYVLVDGYRWIQVHDPVITVEPDGAVIGVVPAHRQLPVRIPFRAYSLLELEDARQAAKAVAGESGSLPLKVTLTERFDLVRLSRPNPAAVRRQREQEARARRRDAAAVKELAELISDLPVETLHKAARLFARAAAAADR